LELLSARKIFGVTLISALYIYITAKIACREADYGIDISTNLFKVANELREFRSLLKQALGLTTPRPSLGQSMSSKRICPIVF
jgi:hypothetical protein